MDIVVDAGNTLIKVGLFKEDVLDSAITLPTQDIKAAYTALAKMQFSNCIVCSVARLPLHFINYLKVKSRNFILLGADTPMPLANDYGSPATLGYDRIAAATGAKALVANEPVLAITAGSCITYNLVSSDNKFKGGAISPGLHMRYKALHYQTTALPLLEPVKNKPALVGATTATSIHSGIINGLVFEIKNYILQCRERNSGLQAVLSGGDSKYLGAFFKNNEITVAPDIALYGLHKILKFNVEEAI